MHRFAANYVCPVSSPPVRNGIVLTDDEGRIMDMIDPHDHFREMSALVFYNGVLIPSLVVQGTPKERKGSEKDMSAWLTEWFSSENPGENPRDTFNKQLKKITLEAAAKIGIQDTMGSLEIGKKPGILLISPFDFERWIPTPMSTITQIV